ncbi:MAG: hypothetical protein R2856_13030 [Caldilineaceae bacterium]
MPGKPQRQNGCFSATASARPCQIMRAERKINSAAPPKPSTYVNCPTALM